MKKNTRDIDFFKWWWMTVDRWILFATLLLISIGTYLITSISPAIAAQHKWSPFILAKKHMLILLPSIAVMMITSFVGRKKITVCAMYIVFLAWCSTWATLFVGHAIKGAKRWIALGTFSLQPSEFLKPGLAVIFASILSKNKNFLRTGWILGIVLVPLVAQPDLGMSFLLSVTWFVQCFVVGLSWLWIGGLFLAGIVFLIAAYFLFPHVAHRFHAFFSLKNPEIFGAQYQIVQATKSFLSGGLLGKGIGSGIVTKYLPDGHADFILAVAGEELGLIACIVILILYFTIFFRCIYHAFQELDAFYTLAIIGLNIQMTAQVLLNVASVLNIIPTKGTTLPFLSYGGSSFLAMCWTMGMILSLTRRFRFLVDI
jgi:cell division protein FtsW